MTDNSNPDVAAFDSVLVSAFAAAAEARERLEQADDNVRAVVATALADGYTWEELEKLSGVGEVALQHRYTIVDAPMLDVVPVDAVLGLV